METTLAGLPRNIALFDVYGTGPLRAKALTARQLELLGPSTVRNRIPVSGTPLLTSELKTTHNVNST